MKKVWQIKIQESGRDIAPSLEIPITHISENNLKSLLKVLAAKYGLNDAEIVGSHLRGNIKLFTPLLEVRKENHKTRTTSYSCGYNPHIEARVKELKK